MVPACLAVEITPRVGQVWQQAEVAPVTMQQLRRGGGSVPPGQQHHCEVVTSASLSGVIIVPTFVRLCLVAAAAGEEVIKLVTVTLHNGLNVLKIMHRLVFSLT